MIEFLLTAAFLYGLALASWVFYLAVMSLSRVKENLLPFAKVNAYVVLGIALPLDVILNVVFGTLLFAQLPREWLFTSRLKRNKRQAAGWRWRVAEFICARMLNQFDPSGNHC